MQNSNISEKKWNTDRANEVCFFRNVHRCHCNQNGLKQGYWNFQNIANYGNFFKMLKNHWYWRSVWFGKREIVATTLCILVPKTWPSLPPVIFWCAVQTFKVYLVNILWPDYTNFGWSLVTVGNKKKVL